MSNSSNYYFTPDHELFRQGVRDFLQKEIAPHIDHWEKQQQIPKEIWKKMGDMGYLGLIYPEQYGGSGVDFFYSVVFIEEVSKLWSGGFAAAFTVQEYMSSTYIFKNGSELLKQKYLTRCISGDLVSSIAITEPGAGSDVANIQTKAIRHGDHYILNGSKTFITNAYYGDILVVVCKTNPEAGVNGVSLLLVERNSPGITARKLDKLGWHASDTAELFFDNVEVPAENLIGEEGLGFFYLMDGLQTERLVGAIGAISGCEAAIDYSLEYMSQRQAFGRSINKFQVLRHRIAQLASEITCTKYFVYHCCRMHNDGLYAVKECSMAKLMATELSDDVAYQCLQFFGGYGYMEEFKMARMFRDSRILTIGGGSSEIMREIIAKMVIEDINYSKGSTKTKANTTNHDKELNGSMPVANMEGNSNASVHTANHSYTASGLVNSENPEQQTNSQNQSPQENNNSETVNHKINNYHNNQTNEFMSYESTLEAFQKRAVTSPVLGKSIKFDFGDQHIFIDGTGEQNIVTGEDKDADCVVNVTLENLEKLVKGDLNPMTAFMMGKLKVKGDMSVAMKLQSLLG